MGERAPMTEAMFYVLLALQKPAHGYGMMPGTLYGVLTRMHKEGWICLEAQEGRRKTYHITQDGEEALQEEYARLKRMVEDGGILEGED